MRAETSASAAPSASSHGSAQSHWALTAHSANKECQLAQETHDPRDNADTHLVASGFGLAVRGERVYINNLARSLWVLARMPSGLNAEPEGPSDCITYVATYPGQEDDILHAELSALTDRLSSEEK